MSLSPDFGGAYLLQPDAAVLPLLPMLLATPLLAALLLTVSPARLAQRIGGLGLLTTLAGAVYALLAFDPMASGLQWQFRQPWLPTLGSELHLALDGLAALLLPLACLPFVAAWLYPPDRRSRLYFVTLLLQLALTLLTIAAQDRLLFFFAWEASLLPIWLWAARWPNGPRGRHDGTHYVLLMLGSGMLLLFGLLLAAQQGAGFELNRGGLSPEVQRWVFLLVLLGIAAKLPLLPLHLWLPRLAISAPVGVLATFMALKLGAFALYRLLWPLAPDAIAQLHWLLAGAGVFALLFGAVTALGQSNLRSALAYVGMSHIGLVLLGFASDSPGARQGALLLLLTFPLINTGVFMLLAGLHQRCGSTDIHQVSGLAQPAPRLAALLLFFLLAGIGLPGLAAFPAEWLIFAGVLQTHTGAALAALFGLALAAAAVLRPYRALCYGQVNVRTHGIPDLNRSELAFALLLAGLALAVGLQPELALQLLR